MSEIGDRLRAQAARDLADADRLQGTRESLAAEEATLRARADQALADALTVDAAMTPPAPTPAPVPSPPPAPRPPPGPVADYRAEARHLFQPIAAEAIAPRLPGQAPLKLNKHGPTATHVCYGTGWAWQHAGGDWIDRDGVPQGPTPWATARIDAVDVGQVASYEVDVTDALREAVARGIPFALLLTCKAPRQIDTTLGANPPVLIVDGVPMPAHYAGNASGNNPAPSATMAFPAFVEFDKPDAFKHAVLGFDALTKARNADPTLTVWLLAPDRSLPPVLEGAGAATIYAHDYSDERPATDFLHIDADPPWARNIGVQQSWSAELWGGPVEPTKFPYRGAGKWIGAQDNAKVSVVRSADIPHGPIRPGLGALCVDITPDPQAVEGGYAPQAGYLACRLDMPLPVGLCGKADHLFVRQYFAWDVPEGDDDTLDLSDVVAVYRGANSTAPSWGSFGGKFLAAPTHDCTSGGFSGSSGGPYGWQDRGGWGFPLTGSPGPMAGTMQTALHYFDFQHKNVPGYAYAGAPLPHGLGKVGGALRARRWYCIEVELKLNSVDTPEGWAPDGEQRVWVDGMLAREDLGLVMRSRPVVTGARPDKDLFPIDPLGVRSVMLNIYVGGTTPSCKPHRQYYGAFACGTEYIGPLKD